MRDSSEPTPEWALALIQIARNKQATELSLNGSPQRKLTAVPPELVALPWLQKLDLSGNQITAVPDSIANFPQLRWLYLNNNRLTAVPQALATLTQLQSLDLSNNQLSALPESFAQLSNLQTLGVSSNKFTTFPQVITQLFNLQSLYLSNNQLTAVPDSLANLVHLQWLDLSGNCLRVVPDALANLRCLQTLYLNGNQLTAVPDALAQLVNLQELYLTSNQLKSLPDALAQLVNLQTLDLIFNQLTNLPDSFVHLRSLHTLYLSRNRLMAVPPWMLDLPQLTTLYLDSNPIKTPPPELLKLEWNTPVDLKKVRAYYRQTAAGIDHLFEAKLLIVGEPGAGKTTLTRKLLNPQAPAAQSADTTEGVDVHTWQFTYSPPPKPNAPTNQTIPLQFRVNVWDFGGQAIYYATHQFFLTRRSLYVVVADAREQKTDFYHWLDSIEHLSNGSPVLIFNNEKENRQWTVNERQLRAQFSNLKEELFAFNLLQDERSLERLRRAIQYHITHLPHVGDALPRTWTDVRYALEADPRPHISLEHYFDLCGQYGFTRREDKLQLSSYLHDLGVILHFQDLQDDPLLKKMVILKPEWGTDAVYRVLDNELVQRNLGQFSRADLSQIWHEEKYADMHDELLALMMKFQLCYQIPDQPGHYIAPQLLSEQHPPYDWPNENNLTLRYKYEEFMPRGLLTRFIVAMHEHIMEQHLVWRTGIVLEKNGACAEVVEHYSRREIRIRVIGRYKRDLLTIIIHELDKLHRPFHQLKYDHLIPCNCDSCQERREPHFYRMEDLKIRLEHGKQNIECNHPPFHTVNIWNLIDGVGSWVTPPEKRAELLAQITSAYDLDELKTLCFQLGLDAEALNTVGKTSTARELILYLERRGRLGELVQLLQTQRPYLV